MARRRKNKRAGRDEPTYRNNVDPYVDNLFCPQCHATIGRHGKSRCKSGPVDPCPGIECRCFREKKHFVSVRFPDGTLQHVWRQSPCHNAVCLHCGWTGMVYSTDFERVYGHARCTKSPNGMHYATFTVETLGGKIRIIPTCEFCGARGSQRRPLDVIRDFSWELPEEDDLADGEENGQRD